MSKAQDLIRRMKSARESATQGIWERIEPDLCYNPDGAQIKLHLSDSTEDGFTLKDEAFAIEAANSTTALCEMLSVALETLELTRKHFQHPNYDANWALYLFEKHSDALTKINSLAGEVK